MIRVALLGYGRIGQAVAQLVLQDARAVARLRGAGIEVDVTGALVRDRSRRRAGPGVELFTDSARLLACGPDVAVEVMGGVEPARAIVRQFLSAGIPVATANKSLLAACGDELREVARRSGAGLACEAAVLAGVPFLGSLARRPLLSAAARFTGILNGTSHFVTTAVARGVPMAAALDEARARGYAEPDSESDVSGRDAAEKLTILLHLAGCRRVHAETLTCLPLDDLEPSDFDGARRLGGTIKPVATATLAPVVGAWVGPAFVPIDHPLARVEGVGNALQITGPDGEDVLFAGPGAGPAATAATIVDDVVELISSGVRRNAPVPALLDDVTRRADGEPVDGPSFSEPPPFTEPAPGSWLLRVGGDLDVARGLVRLLEDRRVRVRQAVTVRQRLFVRTGPCNWSTIRSAASLLAAAGLSAATFPVLEQRAFVLPGPARGRCHGGARPDVLLQPVAQGSR